MENWDNPKEEEKVVSKPEQSEPGNKKLKKKSKLRQAIAQAKPTFDPSSYLKFTLNSPCLFPISRGEIFRRILR